MTGVSALTRMSLVPAVSPPRNSSKTPPLHTITRENLAKTTHVRKNKKVLEARFGRFPLAEELECKIKDHLPVRLPLLIVDCTHTFLSGKYRCTEIFLMYRTRQFVRASERCIVVEQKKLLLQSKWIFAVFCRKLGSLFSP